MSRSIRARFVAAVLALASAGAGSYVLVGHSASTQRHITVVAEDEWCC